MCCKGTLLPKKKKLNYRRLDLEINPIHLVINNLGIKERSMQMMIVWYKLDILPKQQMMKITDGNRQEIQSHEKQGHACMNDWL